MYTHHVSPFGQFSALHMTFAHSGRQISCSEAFAAWQADRAFVDYFCTVMADVPFDAYFWETPPVTAVAADRPFEMVLIDSPALAKTRADSSAFAPHLETARRCNRLTASFPNQGGDAFLIAPVDEGPSRDFAHLAAFLRSASREHRHAFWKAVGEAVDARLGAQPLWISTSGLGVPWLHVRLDSQPKYYQHEPFRHAPAR